VIRIVISARQSFRLIACTRTLQLNSPNTTIGVAQTGVISSAGSPTSFQRIQRQIQLGAKLTF